VHPAVLPPPFQENVTVSENSEAFEKQRFSHLIFLGFPILLFSSSPGRKEQSHGERKISNPCFPEIPGKRKTSFDDTTPLAAWAKRIFSKERRNNIKLTQKQN